MSKKRRDNKGCVFRTGESQRKDRRYLYKSEDGYHGFLFVDDTGRPNTARRYQDILKYAVQEYNQTHADQLPKVTPHVLRRTFCTRLANRNINPKSLQYIMGHSDINITLNLYAHVSIDRVKTEEVIKSREKKRKVSSDKSSVILSKATPYERLTAYKR